MVNLINFTASDSGVVSSNVCNGQRSRFFMSTLCGRGGDPGVVGQNGRVAITFGPFIAPSPSPSLNPSLSPSSPSTSHMLIVWLMLG